MEERFGDYVITDDKSRLDIDAVHGFIRRSYWAPDRTLERMRKAIDHSRCYGVYGPDGRQVAFARVVTDEATVYYLADVFVDESVRGVGIGKAMVRAIVESEELRELSGILATADAHGLYEKYGFERNADRFLRRPANAGANRP